MSKCPNKSLKEWKDLSNKFGNDLSYKLYWMNNDNIPDINKANELLEKYPEIQDSFYLGGEKLTPSIKKQILTGLELFFLNEYFIESSGNFDSLYNKTNSFDKVLNSVFPKIVKQIESKAPKLAKLVDENKEYLKELLIDKLAKYQLTIKQNKKKKEKNTNDEGEDDLDFNDLEEGKENKENSRDTLSVDHAIYYNTKNGFPKAVKLLIASSIARDSEGKPIISKFGLFTRDLKLESLLLNTLADVPWNITDQIVKLRSIEKYHPSISFLIKKLGGENIIGDGPISNIPYSKLKLRQEFSQAFGKHKYEFLIGLLTNKDFVITNANQESLEKQIETKWASNFLKYANSLGTIDNYFNKLEELLNSDKADREIKIAEALGIELTNQNILKPGSVESLEVISNTKWKVADYISNIASALLESYKNNKQTDLNFVYQRKGQVSPIIGNITKLIKHISKYEMPIDLQLINGEGKTVYSINLHTYQSLITTLLNDRSKNVKNELPHLFNISTENSVWLKEIADKKARIEMVLLDAIGSNDLDTLHLSDVKENDIMAFAIKSVLNDIYPAIKHSDRSMFPAYIINVEGWSSKDINNLIVEKNNKSWSGLGVEKFKDVIVGYLWDEYNTAKLNTNLKIDHFDNNKNKSFILDDVEWILRNYATKQDLKNDLKIQINNFVTNYLNETYDKFESYQLLQESDSKNYIGISQDDLDKYTTITKDQEKAKNFIIGLAAIKYFIGAQEQFKLFLGDASYYNIKNEKELNKSTIFDIAKRANMQSSSKNVTAVNAETNAWVKQQNQNDTLINPKTGENYVYKNGKVDGTFTELVIGDDDFFSALDDYFKIIYEGNPSKYEAFKKFTENDGISLVNPFFNREFQHRRSDWSDAKQRTFEKELDIINRVFTSSDKNKRDIELNDINQIPKEALDQYTTNGVVDYDKIFLEYYSPFVVEKPQYLGPNYGMDIEEYKRINPSKRLGIIAGRKTSYMNLLPSMVKDTILEDVLMFMLKNGIDTIHFNSAAKFGALKESKKNEKGETIVNFRSFYKTVVNEQGEIFTDGFNDSEIDPLSIGVLDFRFLGKQQEISGEMKDESTESTQKRKIIQSGIINDEVPIDYKGTKEKWESLTINEQKEASPLFKDLRDYIDSQNEIIHLKLNELLKEFGYSNGVINKPVNFINSLIRQAKDRNSPDNILESLQNWMYKGGLKYIETLPNYNRIQNILNSIINNNVVNEKRPGTAVPQIPSTGFERKGTKRRIVDGKIESQNGLNDDAAVKYYTLNEDGTVNPAEIMIPLPIYWIAPLFKYYKNRGANLNDNDIQGLLNLVNSDLADGTLKNLATYTGLRIPNQQLSSTDVLTVKKFFHPSFQSGAVVPSELVVKTGGDFDIDKLNLYFLNLNDEFESIGGENAQSVEDILNENIDNNTKIKKLQNFNLKKGQDLLLKYQTARFLSPVDDSSLKVLKNDTSLVAIKKTKRNHIYKISTLPKQTTEFLAGKGGTGIIATWITFSNIAQVHGIKVMPYYREGENIKTTKLIIKDLKGNEYDLGYSLGNITNISKQQVEDVLSALLTSQVDLVKDAYATDLSITTNTLNVICYLCLRGAPIQWIIRFLKEPIIATYINERNLNESYSFKVNNLDLPKKMLLRNILDAEESQEKKEILKQFINFEEQAKRVNDFKAYISADTKTLKDLNEYDLIEDNLFTDLTKASEKKDGVYDYDLAIIDPLYINELKKNSVIAAFFESRKTINTLYNNLYLTRQKSIKRTLRNIKNAYAANEKKDIKNKIFNKIDEEFINYLIQTRNDLFKDKYEELIKGDNSLAKRLIDLKKSEKFKDNQLIKDLISVIDNDNQDKVKLIGIKLTTPELNEYADFFKSLKYTDESLYNDLIIANAFISGLSPSTYQLSKIIPYSASKILLDTLLNINYNNITDQDFIDFVSKLPLVRPDILPKFSQRWKKNKKYFPFYKVFDSEIKKTKTTLVDTNNDDIIQTYFKNTNYRQELSNEYINYTRQYVQNILNYIEFLNNKEGINNEVDDTNIEIQPTTPAQPATTNIEINKEVQDVINYSNLEKGEYEVMLVNGVQTFVNLRTMPKTIKKGYNVFYSDYLNGKGLMKRAGKKLIIPGFEDIELMLDQEDKSVIELSTGLMISTKSSTQSKIIEELKNIFETKNVRSVIEKSKKINANQSDTIISKLEKPTTTQPVKAVDESVDPITKFKNDLVDLVNQHGIESGKKVEALNLIKYTKVKTEKDMGALKNKICNILNIII